MLARAFGLRALALDEASFEPGHPRVATSRSNLALVLMDLGEVEEARALLTAAYGALRRSPGESHPTTNVVRQNLQTVNR